MKFSEERRAALLDKLADYVLAEGLSAASLRPMARAAGTSDRMLMYYFKDKPEVIAATLERIAERLVVLLNERRADQPLPFRKLRARLHRMVLAEELWPFMQVWLEVAALAARKDPLYRQVGERIGRGFLAWAEEQLDSATPAQRRAEAARLFVVTEGSVLLGAVGMHDVSKRAIQGDG